MCGLSFRTIRRRLRTSGNFRGVARVLLAVVCLSSAVQASGAEPFEAVLVRFDADYRPIVAPVNTEVLQLAPGELGLIVWVEQGAERWQVFHETWTKPGNIVRNQPVWLVSHVRNSRGSGIASPSSFAQLTTQLDPLMSPSVMKTLRSQRSAELLTPPNGGTILNPRLTIRRTAEIEQKLPSAVVRLSNESSSVEVAFPANQSTLAIDEIPDLPTAWKDGLPAGEYTLGVNGKQPIKFFVETASRREQVTRWLDEWRGLTVGASSSLYVLVAVEYLLAQQPRPYLADALDVLDGLREDELTPYLKWRRRYILSLLRSDAEPPSRETADHPTGIVEIDQARKLIARGRWEDARKRLETAADTGDARGRALSDLYRGVIHAESGLGQEQATEFYFRRAIVALNDGATADRFRAYNNYANFLLNRTQDRLFNHAFQMATGVRSVFVTALLSWEDARRHYEAALSLAAELGADERASAAVNLARAYAVMADVLGTLDSSNPTKRQLQKAEKAINQMAQSYARQAAALSPESDPYVLAVAEAIEAHLAFRADDAAVSREHALNALAGYLRVGSLTGIESIQRLLGLLALRGSDEAADEPVGVEARREALKCFQMSHLLAELLRAQMPADRVGLTRAGFFARRIYVNERIVELLIADGKDTEALRYVELAKARALQDLLATEGTVDMPALGRSDRINDILAEWPRDVMAIEYFLTTERAWAFVVDTSGKVKSHPLVDATGQPLAARDLVARVQNVLSSDMNNYSVKLRQRVLDGLGFDHQWQDTLHRLCRELIPPTALAQLDEARILLIVPHHILHYFPFVALVTQRDDSTRDALEIAKPHFLIDKPCSCNYAPSLIAWDALRQRSERAMTEADAVGITNLPGETPLPGVEEEIQSLRAAFGRSLNTVLTGQSAHKANVLALLRQPGLLLVGTHGQNWPDWPLASELLLYPRGRENGRLTAAELYFCPVDRDLVVLSACYTGLADKSPLPGDDLFGLQRALLQSGARSVISGQWDIYDGTGPELMRGFFDHLAEGKCAPAALAESQRQFLERLRSSHEPEPWLHPYFWAVFTVAGDDRIIFKR